MINIYDRIKERTYTIGTGNFALSGVVQGFSSFSSVYSNSGQLFYAVTDGTNYEIGSGLYLSSNNQIKRFPIKSTNSNNLVSFTEGLKEIYVTYPANNAVFSTSGLFSVPQSSGLAFWNSSNALSYSNKFTVDSGNGRIGINKINPTASIDVGGSSSSSNIKASGFVVGNSGVFFPSGNNGLSSYIGGTQLTHFEMNQTDVNSASVIQLSGSVNQNILLKKQNAGTFFAGPPSGCSPPCSPNYPIFRPLTVEDMPDLSSLYERSSCDGRLSIDPVDPLAEGNGSDLYFVPYNGNRIGLYNGTSWKTLEFTSTLVKNVYNMLPAGGNFTPNDKVFDIFAYSSGNTVQFESLVWSNQTTRQVELYLKDGIQVKFNDHTRRYIGSVMPIDFGGYPPNGGSKFVNINRYRYIFNYYNRVNYLNYYKTARTWTCNSNSWGQLLNTYIAFLNSLTINVLCGTKDDTISVNVAARCESPNIQNANYMITVNSSNFDLSLLESTNYSPPTLTKHIVGLFSLDYQTSSVVQLLGSINQVVPVGINTYYVAERKLAGYNSPTLVFDYSNGIYGTWRC
jgi:hypothetical protein